MGSLCALDLVTSTNITHYTEVHLYTYGSPRIGDQGFADAMMLAPIDPMFRVVHEHDIVPHLPPQVLGFHHGPHEVWNHNGTYILCDGQGEDPKCSDSLPFYDYSISDHLSYFNIGYDGC